MSDSIPTNLIVGFKDHFTYLQVGGSNHSVCKWCKRTRAANPTRDREHLAKKCTAFAIANGRISQPSLPSNFFKPKQTPRNVKFAHRAFALACFTSGRPFNAYEGKAVATAFHLLDSTFEPPNRKQVASWLDDIYDDYRQNVAQRFATAKHLNFVFDGSDDVSFNRVINISVEIPGQAAFYWETIDTKAISHSSLDQVALCMPSITSAVNGDFSKVNSVCTDTNATQRKYQQDLQALPQLSHIFGVLCDAHGLQLLVKDIATTSPWRSVLDQATTVITYFRHSKKQYARLRKVMVDAYGKTYSLLAAAITRWGSQQSALQSLQRVKVALMNFCADQSIQAEAHTHSSSRNTADTSHTSLQRVLDIVNSPSFWRQVSCLLAVFDPIVTAQKQSETDRSYIHRVIPRWLHIKKQWQNLQYSMQWQDVDWSALLVCFHTRFTKQTTSIHWAAYSFDPESFADGALGESQRQTALEWIGAHAPPGQSSAIVADYVQFRLGEGPRYGPGSLFCRHTGPMEEKWAEQAAIGVPLAVHIVARLFKALANSVPSERSFSAANFIHSGSRNRLHQATVDKLVFIFMNDRVLQRLTATPSQAEKQHQDEILDLEDRFLEGETDSGNWLDTPGQSALTTHPNDLADPAASPVGFGQFARPTGSLQNSHDGADWSQNTPVWSQEGSWFGNGPNSS